MHIERCRWRHLSQSARSLYRRRHSATRVFCAEIVLAVSSASTPWRHDESFRTLQDGKILRGGQLKQVNGKAAT
jgi:hypothetical protein